MKNITTKLMLFVAAAVLCISINACKKKTTDSDLSTVQDNTQAESESNYIGNAADAGASNSGLGQPRAGGWQIFKCLKASITIDSSKGPKVMTITFDPTCTCIDGKVRSGQIIVTWTGRYRDSGTVITTTTNNYTVNSNLCQYTKTVTNAGHTLYNGVMVPYFTVTDAATITFTDKTTITWNSSRTRTWTQGYTDPLNWWDTKYSITGSASGTDRMGVAFTVTITNPIILDFSCWAIITQGTIDVQPQGKDLRELNYGTGTCDNNATVTIDGVTYTFSF